MRYRFQVTVDLSKLSPEVGKITGSVNKSMSEFGFDEKMILRTETCSVTLTTENPVTKAQLELIRDELETSMTEKVGEYDLRIEPAELVL
mgnify:CR=1 FL=1